MATLWNAILLRSVWGCGVMADAVKSKKWLKGDKFSAIIRVESFDISIKPILNHFMKLRKNDFNIRFVTEWKNQTYFVKWSMKIT